MRNSRWLSRTAVFALCFAVTGCGTDIFKHTKGTTYGDIMVGDARVSSRERLVNDRLLQDTWLRNELARSDQHEFGFQGATDLRSFVGQSTRLEVNANQLELERFRAQSAQSADAARRQQEQSELDNQLLRQYKQRQLEAMGQQPATAFGYTPPTSKPEAVPAPAAPTGPTVIEDVRKLKDDAAKFTIDPQLLRFPEKLKPTPQEVLRDKLEYRGLIRTEILENALDDRHDLRGNTLLRFDLDAAVRPDDDTSAWAVVTVEIDTEKWLQRCAKDGLYEKWVGELQKDLRERALLLLRQSFQVGRLAVKDALAKDAKADTDRAYMEGIVSFLPDYILLEIQRDGLKKEKKYARANDIVRERAKARVGKPTQADFEYQVFREISAAHQGLVDRVLPTYVKAGLDPVNSAFTLNRATGPKSRVDRFCNDLHDKSEIFAYASTPKESVQRISDVASRRNVSEFMLALSFLAGNTAAGRLYTDYMKVSEGIFQAIRRQPLVVGFSNGTQKYTDAERRTTFGWMLGPRFAINNDGSGSHFRHTVAFNSLSSVVSLPGWLSEVEFKVKTHWVNDDGHVPAPPREKTIPVRLNPDFATITDLLAEPSIREPRAHSRQSLEFDEGAPAAVVIPGQNLWRNPVVLLGGQPADEVSLLPDMRGLLVKFREVKRQRPKGSEEKDLLVVWTSEGRTDAALVKINPAKPSAAPAPEPKATLASAAVVGGELLRIDFAPPQKSFFEMKVFVASLGTGEAKEEKIGQVLDSGAAVTLTAPKFAKLNNGDEIYIQVSVKAVPDVRPPQPFGGPLAGVYYKTRDDAKAKLKPAQATPESLKEGAFTVTFPVKAAIAYPGSDAKTLEVKLEPKDAKSPKAIATPCARDSTKKKTDECAFRITLQSAPEAAAEYKVTVLAKDKPVPLSPDTIKVTLREAAKKDRTAAKPEKPSGKAEKKKK